MRRWIALGLLSLGAALVWAGAGRISAHGERLVLAWLAERGLHLSYQSRGWLPWRGLTFREVVLSDGADVSRPIIALSNLSAEVSWSELWQNRSFSSRWRTDAATLTLTDAKGAVTLEGVTSDVQVGVQNLTFTTLEVRHGQVSLSVTGELALPAASANTNQSADAPLSAPAKLTIPPLNLSGLRATLDALDVKSRGDGLRLAGAVSLDFAVQPPRWSVNLTGEGRSLEWKKVPIEHISGNVTFGDEGVHGSAEATLTSGKLAATLAKEKGETLQFDGTAVDARGLASTFEGVWHSASREVHLSSVSGRTDWLALARSVPHLRWALPAAVRVDQFPALAAESLVWRQRKAGAYEWSVRSVRLTSPAALTVNLAGHRIRLTAVTGTGSYNGEDWRLEDGRAALWGAALTADVVQMAGQKIAFDGSVTDAGGGESQVKGQWLIPTSKLELSSISGQADWLALARNWPEVSASLPKGLIVDRFPALAAEKLVWKMGKGGISESSIQSLRLTTPAAISVIVAGHPLGLTAVTGSLSFDGTTWLLREGHAEVLGGKLQASGQWAGGVFSQSTLKGTNLQMKQMLPWLGSAEPRLGRGEVRFDYAGQLGTESVQATGRGSVQMSEAPLVEVPLLEPTYQFFSGFLPTSARNSSGSMTASFALTHGVLHTDDFQAESQALLVTGQVTLDLPRQTIQARARGEMRGVVGLATSPLSRAMEMKISGSLQEPRITMQNPLEMAGGIILGTADTARRATQLPGKVLKQSTSLPLQLWKILSGSEDAPRN